MLKRNHWKQMKFIIETG